MIFLILPAMVRGVSCILVYRCLSSLSMLRGSKGVVGLIHRVGNAISLGFATFLYRISAY